MGKKKNVKMIWKKGMEIPSDFEGEIRFKGSMEGFKIPSDFVGCIDFPGLKSIVGELKLSKLGTFYFPALESAVGLKIPAGFDESLHLNGLKSAVGLKIPSSFSGYIYLDALESAVGLELPKKLFDGLLFMHGLTSGEGLEIRIDSKFLYHVCLPSEVVINSIPQMDLPLYVNFSWVRAYSREDEIYESQNGGTEESNELMGLYLKRLKGE